MQRVVVVGTSGAGKTTLARRIAQSRGLRHIELDSLWWGPNWTAATVDTFRNAVSEAVSADAWVIDGNYAKARDLTWPRADTIIWLDYARSVVMRRVLWRTARRLITRQRLWAAGNVEHISETLFSRDSIIRWAWCSYAQCRAQYESLLLQSPPPHLRILRFTRPGDAQRWASTLNLQRQYDAPAAIE